MSEQNQDISTCLSFLERFLHGEYGDLVVSFPTKEHGRLDEYLRLMYIDTGDITCDLGVNGHLQAVKVREHSVVLGLQGASTGSTNCNDNNGIAFTVGFFPEFIRLVLYRFSNGVPIEFHFFHTPSPVNAAGHQILNALCSIASIPAQRQAAYLLIRAILEMVKTQIFPKSEGKEGKAASTWRKIEQYISIHLTDQRLTRQELTKHFQMNACYLSSLCHKHTNLTLNEFILRRKLSYAVLLLEQNLPIKQIAQQCGFNETSYFIQVFKRVYGITPGNYRTELE